jgi:hypothetical protein
MARNLYGEEIEEEAEEEVSKPKKKSPFYIMNAIDQGRDIVGESDDPDEILADYNPYITNRSYMRYMDTVLLANELNFRPMMPADMQYAFLINTIRPSKRFEKWLKADEIENIELVKAYYGYNNERAREALNILSAEDIDRIKKKMHKGGDMK